MDPFHPEIRGRGAGLQPDNPYLKLQLADDWEHVEGDDDYLAERARPRTEYFDDLSQTIVASNDSPDIPFRWSVNPYRGCAHGCSYCYARPTHEYLGLSAGLDFETRVMVKRDAPRLLREFLARPGWPAETIAFSGVTDCYQPIERELRITRGCLEVLAACRQPVGVITKNALVTRDLDLLLELASHGAARAALSVTTLDQSLSRVLEPRTSSPAARLRAIGELSAAGVPTIVMVAPIVPGLNDSEIPAILAAARDAGAVGAAFQVLRLPTTVRPIFLDWLARCRPNQAAKVEAAIRSVRGGRLSSAKFGERQTGAGLYAEQIAQTFRVFAKKLGLDQTLPPLSGEAFRSPSDLAGQRLLF
jgi:DNA repair photolyase